MKVKHSYIKKILHTMENMNSARPTLATIIQSLGMDNIDEKFLLHYELLFDYGFIEQVSDGEQIDGKGIIQYRDGEISWANVTLRITANGHEFIQALGKDEVWEIIKNEFKDSSIKTIFKVATELATDIAKKKLQDILLVKR